MPNLNCRYHEKEFPEEGEIVVGKILETTDLGVFIEIVEYNNIGGLIVVGELTRKRITNVNKAMRNGKFEVLFVSRIDRRKKYIDLSRLKVTPEERVACLNEHYKRKVAHNTMATIAQRRGIDLIDLYKSFGWPKTKENRSLYDYFLSVQNDPSLVENEEMKTEIIDAVNLRLKINKLKVVLEIKVGCYGIGGVYAIRRALMEATKKDNTIEISLIKPPFYSISICVLDAKIGLESVEIACMGVKSKIEEMGGYFIKEKEPIIYGEQKADFDLSNFNDAKLFID